MLQLSKLFIILGFICCEFSLSMRPGSILMSTKGGKNGVSVLNNIPRKLKRSIRSADTVEKFKDLLNPETEKFLIEAAQGEVYLRIMHNLKSKGAYLKVPIPVNFGQKPIIVKPNIIEAATSAGGFTTLLAAVNAAGLTSTLAGEGGFTLFGPTDEAFAALPEGTITELLADIPKLTKVLTYHVLPAIYKAKKVLKVTEPLITVNADAKLVIKVDKKDKTVTIGSDGCKLVKTDIICNNGVIHAIDKVLMPK